MEYKRKEKFKWTFWNVFYLLIAILFIIIGIFYNETSIYYSLSEAGGMIFLVYIMFKFGGFLD